VSSSSGSVWYVYGIVPASLSPATLPSGLDDSDVRLERNGDGRVAALVSVLDGERYSPAALESTTGDVEWLSPRAMAHDRVLTWASDRGPVVPLPMFSLFSGESAVQAMLSERSAQLSSTLAEIGSAREYALRVYRVDSELLASMDSLSPRLKELAANAAAAAPGQRYLLERKLDGEKKSEMRAVTQQLVDEIVRSLSAHSVRHVRSPIPRTDADASRGVMVLNAAFLVKPERFEEFQKTLTALVSRHDAHGLRFDFTGPWPAYHFVGGAARE
jgi:hypothetical protein